MSNFNKLFDKKYLKIILMLLCGTVGIFLLVGVDGLNFGENNKSEESVCEMPNVEEYEKKIEEKVIRLCSSVRGVGSVSAVVTLDGGYTAVYAQDSQSSGGGYRNEFVLIGGGSAQEPLLIGYKQPEINGIGIICSGGEEYQECEIISLVSATFGISPSKIYVADAKK